ncbi:peptidyl-prolyl cis-trans isomerase B (cyclophilin B) [Streptacidiphilus jiangxiensis]|uniref:Peptidyl-prolyl cis-trans isomerase n=2 Tax=Streptacidiphilus jiangxiensis TaxID=235985 RepID=A0A1H7S4T4_STRJI|nr:peptidylprolyl isomerase [Streptacidiphilus jiangxiensis]SEL67612.1 peptidyl-prolyl cis-trans isomerase B (cyclophilin B) [Streptacidiphilus jiangxiensis]
MSEDPGAARRARMEALRAQEQAKARQRRMLGIGAVVLVVLLATGGILWATLGSSSKSPSASAASGAFCGNVASGDPSTKQWSQPPAMSIDTKATYTATLKTSCGDIGLKLDAAHAPKTVNSFLFLAQQGFFDHSHCHRLTTNGIYVLQCGDPTATGTGGPGYKFDDEYLNDPAIQGGTYPAGTLAMANSGPNTNGSQFFLVYKDSQLSPNYTPFGTITSGLDILTHIAQDGSDNSNGQGDGKPNDTVVINSVPVVKH